MRITALDSFRLPDTSTAVRGSTYTVPDQFGQERVGEGRAIDPDAASAPGRLVPLQIDQGIQKIYGGASEVTIGGAGSPSERAAGLYGDSLEALEYCAPTTDAPIYGDPSAQPQGAFNPRGVFTIANALLGQPWDIRFAGGVSGEYSGQILARQNDLLAAGVKWVLMDGGRNDVTLQSTVYGGDLDLAYATTLANLTAAWDRFLSSGARVVYLSISPKQTSSGEGTPENTLVIRLNRALKAAAAVRKGVFFIDGFAALVDPTVQQGYGKASLYVDTTHWATAGAFLQALEVVRQLRPFITPSRTLVSSRNDCFQRDTRSLNFLSASDGLFQGTTDAASGTGVSGTKLATATVSRSAGTGSVVASVVAAPAFADPIGDGVTSIGNAQVLDCTAAAAGDQFQLALPVSGVTFAQLGAGTAVQGECAVKVENATNLISVSCEVVLVYTGGSPASPTRSRSMHPVSLTLPGTGSASYEMHLKTPPVRLPANATALTSITMNWFAQFSGAGGAKVSIARASIVKVS